MRNVVINASEAIGSRSGTIRVALSLVSADSIENHNRLPVDWQPSATHYLRLDFTDDGCGISGTDQDKIFDPFYSSKFTGRGLGLPVALGFMRSLGGAATFNRH
jgi:signal transduction histidine kinase